LRDLFVSTTFSDPLPQTSRARLQSMQRESATEYGRALFVEHGEALALALDSLLTRFVLDPSIAGPHHCALPLLLHFSGRGIRPVAAVALAKVLDTLSRRHRHRKLASAIGRAIEDEVKAGRIASHDRDVLRLLRRHEGKQAVVDPRTLRALELHHGAWSRTDRFEVGALLLDLVVAATGLVRLVQQCVRGRWTVMVEPTETALDAIRATPAQRNAPLRTPELVPPPAWASHEGLVSRRDGLSLDYIEGADLGAALPAVNYLQQQALTVDPWMARTQAEAWNANLHGLFSVTRDPLEPPPRPESNEDRQAWRQWKRAAAEAWADERKNKTSRLRIQIALDQALAVAGEPIWFRYDLDFRGRIYSSNRCVTHQGPDHEKAAISFLQGYPCDEDAAEWILKAAAGHWGLGRASWKDRLQWGRDNADRLAAIAEAPLDRLELWREAKEPWQLLQMARAWRQWLQDPSTPITAPIRFDQTTSGLGIAAALVRDERLARDANLIGTTRHDIYMSVAEDVLQALRADLEAGTLAQQRYAAQWLELGIDRGLVKGPVMSSIYGAQYRSLFDGLADHLVENVELQHAGDYRRVIVHPARYLTRRLQELLRPRLQPLLELKRWLEGVSGTLIRQQEVIRWSSPSGFPVVLAAKQQLNAPAHTLLHGSRGWRTPDSELRRDELSARATNRGITANFVHSFDAALAHAVIFRAAGVGTQVLPNHDCFAVAPAKATWLHQTLHQELRTLYLPDWLPEIAAEIACRSGVQALPAPPQPGKLEPGQVGQNSYCFS
jgi:DNA-directed RNA polymerase, mitochondrial